MIYTLYRCVVASGNRFRNVGDVVVRGGGQCGCHITASGCIAPKLLISLFLHFQFIFNFFLNTSLLRLL